MHPHLGVENNYFMLAVEKLFTTPSKKKNGQKKLFNYNTYLPLTQMNLHQTEDNTEKKVFSNSFTNIGFTWKEQNRII